MLIPKITLFLDQNMYYYCILEKELLRNSFYLLYIEKDENVRIRYSIPNKFIQKLLPFLIASCKEKRNEFITRLFHSEYYKNVDRRNDFIQSYLCFFILDKTWQKYTHYPINWVITNGKFKLL